MLIKLWIGLKLKQHSIREVGKMIWKKTKISEGRYEHTLNGFTIDVLSFSKQGFAGSNQVNIFMPKYGGWILGTPKNFKTKKEVSNFVSRSKKKIEKGDYGKRVAFPE